MPRVVKTKPFLKSAKDLKKEYKSIARDIKEFENNLLVSNTNPTSIGDGFFKTRIKNSDKNKGKRAGYRIITFYRNEKDEILLLLIYDKSKISNVGLREFRAILDEVMKELEN